MVGYDKYYLERKAGGFFPVLEADPDAQAFFTRVINAGGALSDTEKLAIDTLVKQMKLDGIWTAMKAVYPMVGASAAACAQNLKSSSFTGTFNGGWTFASTGVKPNGTSAFINTGLIPSVELTTNNTHLSFYSRTQNTTLSGVDMGCFSSGGTVNFALTAYYGSLSTGLSVQYGYPSYTAIGYGGSTQGFFVGSRINTTSNKLFRNTTILGTNTSSNSSLPTTTLNIGSNTASEFQNRECAFASCGDGLTDTQESNFYTAVQAFQTTLSRQV